MFSSTLTFLTLVAPFVIAQSDTFNAQLEVQGAKANFQNAAIVPDLLQTFDPVAALNVSFPDISGDVTCGQKLTKDQVGTGPNLFIAPANSTISLNGTYTLAMVDADVVGTKQDQQTRHWLVNNVKVTSTTAQVDCFDGKPITSYAGPAPPSGSGPHRYVILLYTQPADFKPPQDLSEETQVGKFNFNDYVKNTGLTGPIAGFYFTVEEGTATASLSSTQAVESSTLPAAKQTGTETAGGASSTETGAASSILFQNTAGFGLVGLVASFFL